MVSIKDVAQRAGTSFKTVSRVINADAGVRAETRARVLKAIEELGYHPNGAARTLRSRRSGVIGFLSDRVTTQPHSGEILSGAQRMAEAHGKLLVVINVDSNDAHRQRALKMLLEHQVEGVIYACDFHREVSIPAVLEQLPTVLVNGFSTGFELPTLLPDERRAAYAATRLLLDQGHRRIALITPNPLGAATPLRLAGYRQALAAAGIETADELIETGCVGSPGNQEKLRVEPALAALMARPEPPTAILCGQDTLALQLYLALARKGLRVGEDIAVASFDDQAPISRCLIPSLTTMALPHLHLGQQAMAWLLSPRREAQTTLLPFLPIERHSHLRRAPCD